MSSSEVEICANCKRQIGLSEEACVFNGKIVCAECDRKLRIASELQSADLPESQVASLSPESISELGDKAMDKEICETLGLDGLEVTGAREKEKQTTGSTRVYKCYVCGQRCPWDPVLKANYNPICKRCSQEQKLKHQEQQQKREMEISRRRKAERKWGILGGLGLYLLGVGLIIFAVWGFFQEPGSFAGTVTACVLIAAAVPCFKVGTEFLRGAGLLPW